jgi:pimeloyl-ACP methyl ester carboxylesterase
MAKRKKPAPRTRQTPAVTPVPAPDAADLAAVDGGTLPAVDSEGHSEFELENEAVEAALQTGEHAGLLEDYFGPEHYAELRQLAREASTRSMRGAPRVLILPGIMGSTLGRKRKLSIFDDVFWFDPVDVVRGRLKHLVLPPGSIRLQALGVILFTYLKLKLRLRAAGYDADFHPFDWRQSIADSGKELKARLDREGGDRVSLVAHSMGGLVARWALNHGGRCKRLIMLGTPNFGSFAPVQALRATYPLIRKVAFLDRSHTPEDLARDVFSSFDGLTEMLPAPARWADVDVYDLANWPDDDLRPRKKILQQVQAVQAALGEGADNFFLIAGVDQETTTGLRVLREPGADGTPVTRFEYDVSRDGDGTVPLAFAQLPGVKTYYVVDGHGSLPNNARVAQAVRDILDRGETSALPDVYTPAARRDATRSVSEEALRVTPFDGRRSPILSQREVRHLIDEVAAPDAREETAPLLAMTSTSVPGSQSTPPGYRHPFERVVVGRRRQHRIDLRFALGSITEVDTRALALGVFRDVAPSGAASVLDGRLGGAITELSRRRMFSAQVGEIFMLPTGRHAISADLVAFVGLGSFDRFNDEVLQIAAENVIRTFINTRVEEFATVVFGGGSGESPASGLRNLLTGFIRGLCDADRDHHFRRLVICEFDPGRYLQLKEELYRLSSTALCQDVEITFDEVTLPAPLVPPALPRRLQRTDDPVYLIVRQERRSPGDTNLDVRSSLLTAGSKATVVTGVRSVPEDTLASLCARIATQPGGDFSKVGQQLAALLLAPEVRQVLPRFRHDHHLVVVHDGPMSRVPWETLAFAPDGSDIWHPAAERGLIHRYEADNLSVAKWLESRIDDDVFRALLVVDPTSDLQGARVEGQRVLDLFRSVPGCIVDQLYQEQATKPALMAAFSSGRYDVVHYAGHAEFDEANPAQSGLVCHGGVRLTGAELAGLGNLPTLVFFNACESARVRKGARTREDEQVRLERVHQAVGLAEAFMRGGVANFLGTYWPVGDAAAEVFAKAFYTALLRGEAVGAALQAGRGAVRAQGSKDWANYTFYGSADFVLKAASRGSRDAVPDIDPDQGTDVA